MIQQIDNAGFEKFGRGFLEKYFQNGFASMPKREVDLLVFHLLRTSAGFKGKSIYELSTLFKISESKVKSLMLEGSLRHAEINHKAVIGAIVRRYIDRLQRIDLKDGYCEVALDDPVEKREFEHAVKLAGHHVEYGINRDILKIRPIRFLEIILQNIDNGEREFTGLVKAANLDAKKQKEVLDKSLTFREKLNKLGEEISDKSGLIGLLGNAVRLL